MKKLLKPITSWWSNKAVEKTEEATPAPPPVQVSSMASAPAPNAPRMVPPPPRPQPRTREPSPVIVEAPAKTIEAIVFNSSPEVTIVKRGAKTYAACPQCQANWNIRERISHPSFRRDGAKTLTCPACDKEVSLPKTLDLHKLS